MTWLLPSALAVAGIAVLAAFALHFIARSRPLAEPFPTARFIPARPVHARTRSFALRDLLLLCVRIAAILALGLAVAAPVFASRGRVARVLVIDRSRAVASATELGDSVRTLVGGGATVIVVDSIGVMTTAASLESLSVNSAHGSMSAMLAAGIEAASGASARSDSVELIVVSPFAREEIDSATDRIRSAWPGRIRLVPVAATPARPIMPRVESAASTNDAVVAGLSLAGVMAKVGNVRLVRGHVSAADSAIARDSGRVLLHWPENDSSARWLARTNIDAIGGVTSPTGTLVARFPRLWVLQGQSIAHWVDGEAAAVERPLGRGCIRDVGVLIDQSSDVTLHASFRQFAASLLVPCGGARVSAPIGRAAILSLAGSGPLAASIALHHRAGESSRWTPWLLALGAVLLIIELVIRRTETRPR